MKQEKVVVLGAGGHARVVAMALDALGYKSGVFLDDDALKRGVPFVGGWEYAGPFTNVAMRKLALKAGTQFIVGIGSVDAYGCGLRDKCYQMALASGPRQIVIGVLRPAFGSGSKPSPCKLLTSFL